MMATLWQSRMNLRCGCRISVLNRTARLVRQAQMISGCRQSSRPAIPKARETRKGGGEKSEGKSAELS